MSLGLYYFVWHMCAVFFFGFFFLICCFVVVVWAEGVHGQAGRVESAIHFKQAVN